jgi:hypothetical protein
MTQYLALKIQRNGRTAETALQLIMNDYTILPIATDAVEIGIKAIRDERTSNAATLNYTPAQQHRAFHVLDLFDGFGDGIEYARLQAGIHFIRYGTGPEISPDLIKLFASFYYGAEEAGAWSGDDGDHEAEAVNDITRIMNECAVLDAAMTGHADVRDGLLARTIEVLEPFYEASFGDNGLATLTDADLQKARAHSILIASLLRDHIPDVGKMVWIPIAEFDEHNPKHTEPCLLFADGDIFIAQWHPGEVKDGVVHDEPYWDADVEYGGRPVDEPSHFAILNTPVTEAANVTSA